MYESSLLNCCKFIRTFQIIKNENISTFFNFKKKNHYLSLHSINVNGRDNERTQYEMVEIVNEQNLKFKNVIKTSYIVANNVCTKL